MRLLELFLERAKKDALVRVEVFNLSHKKGNFPSVEIFELHIFLKKILQTAIKSLTILFYDCDCFALSAKPHFCPAYFSDNRSKSVLSSEQ